MGAAEIVVGQTRHERDVWKLGGLKKMEHTDWRMMFAKDVLLSGRVQKKGQVKITAKNR